MSAGPDERQGIGCTEDTNFRDIERPNDSFNIHADPGTRVVNAPDEVCPIQPGWRGGDERRCLGVSQRAERVADLLLSEQIPTVEIGRLSTEPQRTGRRNDTTSRDLVANRLNDVLDDVANNFLLNIGTALSGSGLHHHRGNSCGGQQAHRKLK